MVINEIKFPIYGLMIILSILLGMLYIFINLKEDIKKDRRILLFFILVIPFTIIFGIYFTMIVSLDYTKIGLSSYGGLIGLILSALIFEKILPCNKKIIKYTILSLPLIYGISKIGCFFAGCCYGIPYNGSLNVSYPSKDIYYVFPVQLVETITFLIAFFVLNKCNTNKNIIPITIIVGAILKSLLEFLRHSHIDQIVSVNQIFSIILIIIAIILLIRRNKNEKNDR